MHSKNQRRSSGSTSGVMPWPRFAIHPPWLDPKLSAIRLTAPSMAPLPPNKTLGSIFPWRAILSPTIRRASAGSMHQSRLRTSYPPCSARSLREWLAPLAKHVIGTMGSFSVIKRLRTLRAMCWSVGKEKVLKSLGDSSPAQESKTCKSYNDSLINSSMMIVIQNT